MQKNISKLSYFLFKKEHDVLGGQKLFRFQSELAQFATTIKEISFSGKSPEGIRPFLSQQLKVSGNPMSKPIKNHFNTYRQIVEARFKKLKPEITENELKNSLEEFEEFFSKESVHGLGKLPLLFDEISVELLQQLQVVAIANGGTLTQEEFMKALVNLKNQPPDQK